MTSQSNSNLIDQLIPMWQRALGKTGIGIHDNFFELGGNGTIAERLFKDASQVAPKPLPPVMIFIAPTIASMAQLLEFPDAVLIAPTILLKEGTQAPPIFMTHGLGSSVLDLSSMARLIDTERPIYGLQARGTDGKEEPYDRVEDMAAFFWKPFRKFSRTAVFDDWIFVRRISADGSRTSSAREGRIDRVAGDGGYISSLSSMRHGPCCSFA